MKKPNFIFIITLPLMWLGYCLFELFSQRLSISSFASLTLLPTLILLLISYLFFKISMYFENGLSKKILFSLFIFLLFLDQGIKLIIKIFFFKKRFYIISNLLSFTPIINTKGSWLNARFNININFLTLILINFIALFLFTEVYRYFNSNCKKNFFVDLCYIFIMTGSTSSLIDKTFYGGSLDFIEINNLFVADFKDIYINLAIFTFIIIIYNSDNNKFENDIIEIKRFIKFIITDIKINILKIKKDSS